MSGKVYHYYLVLNTGNSNKPRVRVLVREIKSRVLDFSSVLGFLIRNEKKQRASPFIVGVVDAVKT